jgi:hypothetical protein
MTISDAMAKMRTSKNVREWNKNRQEIHDEVSEEEWTKIYPYIDCDGFITKVLYGYAFGLNY